MRPIQKEPGHCGPGLRGHGLSSKHQRQSTQGLLPDTHSPQGQLLSGERTVAGE